MVDLKSIQHKLSSDYGLNMYFSRRFLYIDGPPFSPHKPLQNVDFSKVSNMQFFFKICTQILTRTQVKKFEDMFFVKIANKRTSLSGLIWYQMADLMRTGSTRSRVNVPDQVRTLSQVGTNSYMAYAMQELTEGVPI